MIGDIAMFFTKDLKLDEPDVYLNAVGADLGETMGNIIAKSYGLMAEIKPDAVLVLGDTNSCLSVIGAKSREIFFTSCGSESDNWAIRGVADKYETGHIITSAIEHPAVMNTCKYLEKKGYKNISFLLYLYL